MIDFIFNLTPGDVIYDIETYPNVFTFCAIHAVTKKTWSFEISEFKDEREYFRLFIETLSSLECRMVGFNNYGFDYPVIHHIYENISHITVFNTYEKAMSIINSVDRGFSHIIWDNNQYVPQIDLYKIHHFDNINRATSLKILEFNMRSDSVEGLPFKVGTILNKSEIITLKKYNKYDVLQTLKFYKKSLDKIKFREELSLKYGKNFLNHNDTKIGKDYFIMELEKAKPGSCYKKVDGSRKMVQTNREFIKIKDIILPYIDFIHYKFQKVLKFYKSETITDTKKIKSAFNYLNVPEDLLISDNQGKLKLGVIIGNLKYFFGSGGIHASVENKIITNENGDYIIEDWDVSSYYPNIAIVNNFSPSHLGNTFCNIYKDVYEHRKSYEKGTSENDMLKLALNGVYGDSNNEYSPFYDPQYTMSITINGQLLLCMLIEEFIFSHCLITKDLIKNIEVIQINTDGFTIKYPKSNQVWVHRQMTTWEQLTGLNLERSNYTRMFIRDVNNYIAVYANGLVKRKGAYEYKKEWHQNQSMLIVPKAVERYLIYGEDIEKTIRGHDDVMDFMLRTKIRKSDVLEWGGVPIQNVTRYYISTDGDILEKVMPPKGKEGSFKRKNKLLEEYYQEILKEVGDEWDERIHTKNKSTHYERRSGIHPDWTVQPCNNLANHSFTDINYDFYIQEAEKLVKELKV